MNKMVIVMTMMGIISTMSRMMMRRRKVEIWL